MSDSIDIKDMSHKTIVVSAVNLIEGGTLTVLRECLMALSVYSHKKQIKIIAIVNNKNNCSFDNIEYIEIPWAKKNWINRVFCEYIYFSHLFNKTNVDIWLSLHDTTPNVHAKVRAVYCHNPSPFYKADVKGFIFNPKEALFSLFYRYLYRINIYKNTYVIVQQDWIRTAFCKMFHLRKEKIIVAPANNRNGKFQNKFKQIRGNTITTFFYPAFPRTFKNFEDICEACSILASNGTDNYRVILTIDGSENKYARNIVDKYSHVKEIIFSGIMSHEEVLNTYGITSCLLFPSKLETWGLPISEFMPLGRPMIIADLPYAYETSNGAKQVAFYDINNPSNLAFLMQNVIDGNISVFHPNVQEKINPPTAYNWNELFNMLLNEC